MAFEPSLFIYNKTPGFLFPEVSNIAGLLNFVFTDMLMNNTGAPFITPAYNGGAFIISILTAPVTPTLNPMLK